MKKYTTVRKRFQMHFSNANIIFHESQFTELYSQMLFLIENFWW